MYIKVERATAEEQEATLKQFEDFILRFKELKTQIEKEIAPYKEELAGKPNDESDFANKLKKALNKD